MSDLRGSILKPFKKLKHRLAKGSRKRKGESGGEDGRDGREHDTGGSETGQSSYLHPETEDVAEGGPSREEGEGNSKEVAQVDPPASMPSIPHNDNGTRKNPSSFEFHPSLSL